MDTEKIERIIDLAEARNLDELEIEEQGVRIRVVRRSSRGTAAMPAHGLPEPTAQTTSEKTTDIPEGLHAVRSPMVGIYLMPDQGGKTGLPLAGDRVFAGDVLGCVEAMKMRTEIASEISGEVVEVLVADQQPVQFHAPLFLLRPEGR